MQTALIYLSHRIKKQKKTQTNRPLSLAAVKEISVDAVVASVLNHSGRHFIFTHNLLLAYT